MGRISTKENKSRYQICREELGLSREKASELMPGVSAERIEKIENEKVPPQPEDILSMSTAYKAPNLCNHYCANECPIGKQYVPEIKVKELPQIVLEMIASLNAMNRKQERLIEITVDSKIEHHEIEEFIKIQNELEKISVTVEGLQLWVERMLASGDLNPNLT